MLYEFKPYLTHNNRTFHSITGGHYTVYELSKFPKPFKKIYKSKRKKNKQTQCKCIITGCAV